MKTNKPVTEGVDATVNVWFLGTCRINQTYVYRCVYSSDSDYFWGQCVIKT